jgi:hypothetical protein
MPPPWHFTTLSDFFDHWQTLIGGGLAFLAGAGTVVATMIIAYFQIAAARVTASDQIKASREDADRMVAEAQGQTAVAQKEIETALRLEELRVTRDRFAFQALFKAAMDRVIAEAKEAKEIFSKAQPVEQTGHAAEYSEAFDKFAERTSVGARYARENFKKYAFSELRGAFLRHGGLMTAEFLELESLIDKFASVTTNVEMLGAREQPTLVRVGYHEGFEDELTDIETKARHLREEAVEALMLANAVSIEAIDTANEDDATPP